MLIQHVRQIVFDRPLVQRTLLDRVRRLFGSEYQQLIILLLALGVVILF